MRHVVFVDDQDAVLSGLRRMLHSLRDQWHMTFLADAHQALDHLTQHPADVVVSDMHMPGMDGAALLAEIRRRWPQTVRIVLTGYADESSALRSVPVAHRFLSKPCDAHVLSDTIRTSCELRDRLARPELRQLIGGLGALPSAPRSYTAITSALSQPEVELTAIAHIIERDPATSAKLLQLVNSAFFGLARSVTQVRDAVSYLGISRVRDIVLAAEIAGMFGANTPDLVAVIEDVEARSSMIAQVTSAIAPPEFGHDAFIAGVLHDIGRLVLAAVAPDRYASAMRTVDPQAHRCADIAEAERGVFGADHAEVGAYLLSLWGLPFTLVDPVARHHDPAAAHDANPVVAALAQAVVLAGTPESTPPPSDVEVHGV